MDRGPPSRLPHFAWLILAVCVVGVGAAVVGFGVADGTSGAAFEIGKAGVQLVGVAVLGGLAGAAWKRAESERSRRHERHEQLRLEHASVVETYNAAKAIRRTLKSAGLDSEQEGATFDDQQVIVYHRELSKLDEVQLEFEAKKRQFKHAELLEWGNDEVVHEFRRIENYLKTFVTAWEENAPNVRAREAIPPISKGLQPFFDTRRFKDGCAHPIDRISAVLNANLFGSHRSDREMKRRPPRFVLTSRGRAGQVRWLVDDAVSSSSTDLAQAKAASELHHLGGEDRYKPIVAEEIAKAEILIEAQWTARSLRLEHRNMRALKMTVWPQTYIRTTENGSSLVRIEGPPRGAKRDQHGSAAPVPRHPPVMALDLHEDLVSSYPHDGRGRPSELGRLLGQAKYRNHADARKVIVEKLAAAIEERGELSACKTVIGMPGHRSGFSSKLAREVAAAVDRPFCEAWFGTNSTWIGELPRDQVPDFAASAVDGPVLLVEDVYRSGMSVERVSKRINELFGVECVVLGVTASRVVGGCGHHC